jgi:glycosyltransferase involved in cell wall biosynthesis
MFRMVHALEAAGHHCSVYIYDQHGWSMEQHKRTIRDWWPWVRAEIRDFREGISDSHAVFATSWDTAYAVLGSSALGTRFYFVQDFEPAFSPAGSEYLLAEATYRFGFHGVTAGRWLAQKLRDEYGMPADHFDFGCDLEKYRLHDAGEPVPERDGICYFSRPSTPRRAHGLAILALELFAKRHPEVPIHLFGEPPGRIGFPATQHGLLTPEQLNALYNRSIAGLILSATNVSLVPLEMLAAGCIPVVNDAEHNRLVLDNPHVAYAASTPFAIADALSTLVERSPSAQRTEARSASESARSATWSDSGAQVEAIVHRTLMTHLGGERPDDPRRSDLSALHLAEGG